MLSHTTLLPIPALTLFCTASASPHQARPPRPAMLAAPLLRPPVRVGMGLMAAPLLGLWVCGCGYVGNHRAAREPSAACRAGPPRLWSVNLGALQCLQYSSAPACRTSCALTALAFAVLPVCLQIPPRPVAARTAVRAARGAVVPVARRAVPVASPLGASGAATRAATSRLAAAALVAASALAASAPRLLRKGASEQSWSSQSGRCRTCVAPLSMY